MFCCVVFARTPACASLPFRRAIARLCALRCSLRVLGHMLFRGPCVRPGMCLNAFPARATP
eukprot:13504127-Alexandrium_andersonii.AAC.1